MSKYYDVDDATHLLMCSHCTNSKSRMHYTMKCIILKEMKDGRYKLLVFGDRYWKDRYYIRKIRYVDANRVRIIREKTDNKNMIEAIQEGYVDNI